MVTYSVRSKKQQTPALLKRLIEALDFIRVIRILFHKLIQLRRQKLASHFFRSDFPCLFDGLTSVDCENIMLTAWYDQHILFIRVDQYLYKRRVLQKMDHVHVKTNIPVLDEDAGTFVSVKLYLSRT